MENEPGQIPNHEKFTTPEDTATQGETPEASHELKEERLSMLDAMPRVLSPTTPASNLTGNPYEARPGYYGWKYWGHTEQEPNVTRLIVDGDEYLKFLQESIADEDLSFLDQYLDRFNEYFIQSIKDRGLDPTSREGKKVLLQEFAGFRDHASINLEFNKMSSGELQALFREKILKDFTLDDSFVDSSPNPSTFWAEKKNHDILLTLRNLLDTHRRPEDIVRKYDFEMHVYDGDSRDENRRYGLVGDDHLKTLERFDRLKNMLDSFRQNEQTTRVRMPLGARMQIMPEFPPLHNNT